MSKTKLRDNKITASRQLAAVPAHSCSYFIISVSQAAAHWLQCRVRQGLGFWYSKIRLVAQCVGIAANVSRLGEVAEHKTSLVVQTFKSK